jgi:hypothetical protein
MKRGQEGCNTLFLGVANLLIDKQPLPVLISHIAAGPAIHPGKKLTDGGPLLLTNSGLFNDHEARW